MADIWCINCSSVGKGQMAGLRIFGRCWGWVVLHYTGCTGHFPLATLDNETVLLYLVALYLNIGDKSCWRLV